MDHESLRTASTYLNNLLLARGLLRNGEPVDFVKPSKESRAQIINLVHDLILREDRDKEQREHVATTMRQLQSEDVRKTHEIERLQTKSEESARAATQAQQAERVALAEVKKVEKAMKTLQDQTTKLKATLAQIKTQCTNDIKKRDLELARLKTHLQGQQRGTRVGMTAPSMTVRRPVVEPSMHDIEDPAYSLKQETTEFLTQLSQDLSDENDNLISLVRGALSTMREILGLPANVKLSHPDSAVGSMGSETQELNAKYKSAGSGDLMQAAPVAYEMLAADMESTLSTLKTILTNPNFVPMEEVEMREEEIIRLREGWEHMESRWREVLNMMHVWVTRLNTGETINIDDLRRGMGLVTPGGSSKGGRGAMAAKEQQDESLVSSETSEIELPKTNCHAGARTSDASSRPESDESRRADISPVAQQSKSWKGELLETSKRKRNALEPPEFFDLRPSESIPHRPTPNSPPKSVADTRSDPFFGTTALEDDESEVLEIPQMTIAEKLSAAQEEAAEAQAARANPTSVRREDRPFGLDGVLDEPEDDTLGKMPGDDTLGRISPMAKRTKIKGRPRKRKSTLSPEELETLLIVDF
ncbi:uncharacterized protein MYCFIDRAFT_80258 [Pseudocercospora fijiensis CIRAD86]|uniref:NIMA interactive protein n=1 Tax=Pseudocercospora fijiensis (strain CIRAD86) TaxID=383855 RepID=M3ADJ9_PSEFD|nr:uncharacterized protein MYCFIDRAFT_80258 [Pseudocercospora fijiensis CIRAD86]EME82621.1 hypothetical protein MYCFIDRAFT_80258 [Pseudocercospora fijiensis CIRAD86]